MAWRDDISEQAQGDLDAVFSQAAMLARTLLMRNKEFFPFGATVSAKGAIGLSTPVPDGAAPTVHDVIAAILGEVTKAKASTRAYAIAALARTADGGEAVRIELEHKEGLALVIGMPVHRDETGVVTYGDMRALPGERLVWSARTTKRAAPASKAATKKAATEKAATEKAATKKAPAAARSRGKTTETKAQAKTRAKAKSPAKAASTGKAASTAKAPAKRSATTKASRGSKPRGAAIAPA